MNCQSNRWLLLLAMPLLILGCSFKHPVTSTNDFPKKTGFVQNHVVSDGVDYKVWTFLPATYEPGKKTPAILFLHGLFEGGYGGGEHVLTGGLGPVISKHADTWPFITIFPQSTGGKWISGQTERLALAALADAEQRYTIDRERIVLAGLSYGGLGVWEIGARHHDLFSALVPVSAFSAPYAASSLSDIPIWAFTGHDDLVVDPENTVSMCQAIRSHGGNAKVTDLEYADHDCWPEVVDQTDIVDWMLLQHRTAGYVDSRGDLPDSTTKEGVGQLKSFGSP